ncbi:11998_t:CDS:2 [Funneliformis geosporum]|uniref:11998_t:CDS:1 n=1 Tax=Funneliformis geosporum TaxID=1117311 RepID=A0A9W4SXP6_9GLOM|nr:11998_t:CDS:2 [Funneliformis geosporum]
MKSLLSNNEKLRKEYKTLNKWLIEKDNKRKLNAIDETRHAVFKKARISSSVVNIGNVHHERDSGNASVNREFEKEKGNVQYDEKMQEIKGVHQLLSPSISEDIQDKQKIKRERESSPPITQKFSHTCGTRLIISSLREAEKRFFVFQGGNEPEKPRNALCLVGGDNPRNISYVSIDERAGNRGNTLCFVRWKSRETEKHFVFGGDNPKNIFSTKEYVVR